MVVSPIPTGAGNVLAIEWAHRDLLTEVSIYGMHGQLNTI